MLLTYYDQLYDITLDKSVTLTYICLSPVNITALY